ncbi:MAG: flagellar biosynthetic protein FliR [Candidatus Tectomicrobia bacterium]|nr:flagellar biosynthetic protein FliR [Candidatus Tectomicrobia bacterium]
MADVLTFSPAQLLTFLFVFTRVGAILLLAPVFGSNEMPMNVRLGFVLIFSLVLLPIIEVPAWPLQQSAFALVPALVAELLIGAILGFTVRLLFAAVQLGGELAGFQMGLAIANVIDPLTQREVSVLSQAKNVLAMLLFVTLNIHYWFIYALVRSFQLVPPFGLSLSEPLMETLVRLSGAMFLIGLHLAAPLMATLLFTTVALGLLAKTVPQINVFIMSMPLNIAVGLLVLGASLPMIMGLIQRLYENLGEQFSLLLHLMGRVT